MKRYLSFILLAVLIALAPAAVWAQAPVQQSATHADATALFSTTASSATTITISPPAGQFYYLTMVEIDNVVGATAVTAAAVTTVTTTGLGGGTTPVWTIPSGTTAGSLTQGKVLSFPNTVKSNTQGANVTFVTPTFATNQTIRVNFWGYYAP